MIKMTTIDDFPTGTHVVVKCTICSGKCILYEKKCTVMRYDIPGRVLVRSDDGSWCTVKPEYLEVIHDDTDLTKDMNRMRDELASLRKERNAAREELAAWKSQCKDCEEGFTRMLRDSEIEIKEMKNRPCEKCKETVNSVVKWSCQRCIDDKCKKLSAYEEMMNDDPRFLPVITLSIPSWALIFDEKCQQCAHAKRSYAFIDKIHGIRGNKGCCRYIYHDGKETTCFRPREKITD